MQARTATLTSMDPHEFLAAEHARLDEQARYIDAARGDARQALLAQYVIDLEIHQQAIDDVLPPGGALCDGVRNRCPQGQREDRWLASTAAAKQARDGGRLARRRQQLERQYLGQEWSVTR